MRRSLSLCTLAVVATMLAGCASSGDKYPSLDIREAERVSGTFQVDETIEPAPLSAQVATSLPEIEASARASHAKFKETAPTARRTIMAASGTTPESNAWAAAQIALADLESLRSDTAIALADLDLHYANTTLRFEQREAVAQTLRLVADMVGQEDAILTELRGAIAP